MKSQAQLNNLRISPQKVRLVADRVRGLSAQKALGQLDYELKHAGPIIAKLIRSAVANAQNNHKMKLKDLIISDVQVNAGPTMKRWRARAYGRAAKIMKRTSKVTVIVSDDKDAVVEETPKAVEASAAQKKTATKKAVPTGRQATKKAVTKKAAVPADKKATKKAAKNASK